MSQYKQWLYHRETDHQLHAQLQHLTEELNVLQQQASELTQGLVLSDNVLVEALLKHFFMPPSPSPLLEASPVQTRDETSIQFQQRSTQEEHSPVPHRGESEEGRKAISSALHSWASLPDFDAQQSLPPQLQAVMNKLQPPPPSSPHTELALSAEDLATSVDEGDRTAPVRSIPWWLRRRSSSIGQTEGPVDEQSARNDQSIQRWLERWGRSKEAPTNEASGKEDRENE